MVSANYEYMLNIDFTELLSARTGARSSRGFHGLRKLALANWCVLTVITMCGAAWAGVPYNVDDAETPDLHSYEVNIASTIDDAGGSTARQLPTMEINYGYSKNTELVLGAGVISCAIRAPMVTRVRTIAGSGRPASVCRSGTGSAMCRRYRASSERRPA